MNPDKIIVIKQQKVINELKAEITYWKETADYWKNVAFEFERHNKYLKELKQNT